MHNEFLDKFFHYASRMVIIFPLIAVALILLLAKNPFQKTQEIAQVTPTPQKEQEEQKTPFDINGSYICEIKTKESSTSAFIKNKSARMITTEKTAIANTLFAKDCLYAWTNSGNSGQKTCGLGQYIAILETFGQFGLGSPDSLLQSLLGDTATGSAEPISFEKVCKKAEVKNDALFQPPQNVNFIEQKAEGK